MNFFSSNIRKFHPVPTIVWGLFIFILCFLPGSAFPGMHWADMVAPDKWVHAILYASWIILYGIGGRKNGFTSLVKPAAIMLVFGALIEFFQEWLLTYRSGEFLDWVADGVGLVAGALVFVLFRGQ